MRFYTVLCVVLVSLLYGAAPVCANNPFQGDRSAVHARTDSPHSMTFFERIAGYQQELKVKMSQLIREARERKSFGPLLLILFFAFGYGVIHAAGPGHGKAVAMTYVLSRKASVAGGALFGAAIALFHGFSGALCVLGLHYVLRQSVSGTLASVTRTTQLVSFGLITLLGLWIMLSHAWEFFRSDGGDTQEKQCASKKSLLPWALSVGMIPCPGVVMVMLFCLSMGMFTLGLLAALAISLGMAVTVSLVVVLAVMGRNMCVRTLSPHWTLKGEQFLGLVSGLAVTIFGVVFFRAAML